MSALRLGAVVAALGTAFALAGVARAGEQTLTFRSASVTVAPYGVHQTAMLIPSPGVDGYVVGVSADVVDRSGAPEPITNVMLHHVVFAKLGYPDATCSQVRGYDGRQLGLGAERFFAGGEERTEVVLPAGYGYPNKGTDRWAMVFMLMNHRKLAETVSVQYTVRYVTDETLVSVRPYWFDVRNCSADPIFSVPGTGKQFSTFARSSELVMPESGRFVAGGAHLHGGGLKLELSSGTCGVPLFTSEPTWGLPLVRPVMHEPGPKHMTTFSAAPGIPVSAGDRVRLRATYDNSLPHTRVMGIMLLYLAPGPVTACERVPTLPADPLSSPSAPPRVVLPLLKQPRGPARLVLSTFVSDFQYEADRVSLKRGSTFRWQFAGPSRHDVTLASGPVGFASESLAQGSFRFRFTKAGTYRLFCSLHPTQMTQIITVR